MKFFGQFAAYVMLLCVIGTGKITIHGFQIRSYTALARVMLFAVITSQSVACVSHLNMIYASSAKIYTLMSDAYFLSEMAF